MSYPIFHVSAFTDQPFGGNPAAVCLLKNGMEPAWMQAVAGQMNLSETAFLFPEEPGYRLRWFTPKIEIALCGHATLASAHLLWEIGTVAKARSIHFQTKSGILTAVNNDSAIELDFPACPSIQEPVPAALVSALGATACGGGRNGTDWLVEVASDKIVRGLAPNMANLAALPVRGVIVTARSADPRFDFVSRFFAPASGVPEDPVTGSAHCCLAPYWASKIGKQKMLGYQASARGGEVSVTLVGDRVMLGGKAVTVLRGELLA
jgi:PhzF family phenazine biosynthesis protein